MLTTFMTGWVESVQKLLDSYFENDRPVEFNYDKIRSKGSPIKVLVRLY